MRSGRMRRVITIERPDFTVNEAGTPVEGGVAGGWTLRAKIVQQSTTEFIRSAAVDEAVIVFRTRAVPVTNADRVSFGGQSYNIKEIAPIENGRGMELRCTRLD